MDFEAGIERSLVAGTRIGRYETQRLLGKGGFGVVFAARDVELDRPIALKILLPEHTYNTQLMQRFFQEARAAAKIEHPAIVTIHDFGRIAGTGTPFDGSAYIAMEMVRGESLAARLHRVGRVSAAEAVSIARQVASALAAAHRIGIIHRDLKPDNLMIAKDPVAPMGERIKVLDFGIAKLAEANLQASQQLKTGHVTFGTPLYMSPEQYRSAGTVDARTDVYALGCILFEMVTGKPPFDGDFLQLFAAHTGGERPLLRSRAVQAPAWLEALVSRMIAAEPDARPASMEDVERALGGEGEPVVAFDSGLAATEQPRASSVPPAVTTLGSAAAGGLSLPPRTQRRWAIVGVAVAAIAVMVAITLAVRRGDNKATAPATTTSPVTATAIDVPVDAPSAAHVRSEAARSQAKAYLDQKLYDHAVAEYQKAYDLEPTPHLLFEIGGALQLEGQSAPAIDAYQRYIAAEPTGADAATAREQIAVLTKLAIAAQPVPSLPVIAKPVAKTAPKRPTEKPATPPEPKTGGKKVCPTNDPVCAFGGP